jgi:hypothetical protein
VNTLIKECKILEKEGRDAATQLARELLTLNLTPLLTPSIELNSKATIAKSTLSTVSKFNPKFKGATATTTKKAKASELVLKLDKVAKVVVGTNSRGRQIVLPQRFVSKK